MTKGEFFIFDVIIVGAGFAGLSLAAKLPQYLKVLVIEQKMKVDAGANTTGLVTEGTKAILGGLVNVEPYITNGIEDICVVAPDWNRHFISKTTFPWIYSTDTPGLLGAMAGNLGSNVTLRTGVRFENWSRETGEEFPVLVKLREGEEEMIIRCRVLVGADGTNSGVAAACGVLSKNKKVLFAYEKVLRGELLLGNNPQHTVYHLWFGSFSIGYGGWIAPNDLGGEKVFRIGYATYDTQLREENKLDKMIRILKEKGYVKTYDDKPLIRYGGYFPVGGVLPVTATDNCVLLGDAAGYCGAFSADGIKGALVSGLSAARLIPHYLDGDGDALNSINVLMERETGLISYYKRQLRYRFLWNRMSSNASFTALFDLCKRERENFLNQFCDAKDMRKSLVSFLLKPRHVPALVGLAGNVFFDQITRRR